MNTEEGLINIVKEKFGELNSSISNAIDILTQDPSKYSPSAWSAVNQIVSVITATAYVLIVLFFLISLLNKTIMFETANYEVTVKLILRFLLAKIIIDNCSGIMKLIYSAFGGLIKNMGDVSGSPLGNGVVNVLTKQIENIDGGFMGIGYITYYIQLQPTLFIIWIVSLVAGVIAIGRVFELLIYTAVAPLPLSTLAGDVSHDTCKRFLQNYISVCLQGVIIVVSFKLFGGIMADNFGGNTGVWAYVMLTIVFCLTLIKSGTWAKQIVGVA